MKERSAAAPGPITPIHPARLGPPDQACSAVQEPEPSAAALQGLRGRSERQGPRRHAARQDLPEQACSAGQGPEAEPSAAALQGQRERTARQGLREFAVLQDLRGRTARQEPPEHTALQEPPERTAVQAAAPRAGEALPGEEAAEGT